jgi:MFS family permease
MAVFGIETIIGQFMGPTLGGWLTYHYSWRWVFYINLTRAVRNFEDVWPYVACYPSRRPCPSIAATLIEA